MKKKSVKTKSVKVNAKPKLKTKDRKSIEKKQEKLERKLAKRKQAIVDYAVEASVLPEGSKEREYFDEYTHIFTSLQKLTRIAEKQYAKSGMSRDVYALCTMYSQMRECIADLRSIQDLSIQSERIITNIIDPMMKSIAQALVEMYFQIEKSMRSTVHSDKEFNELDRQLKEIFSKQSFKIQEYNDKARQQTIEFFANGT